MSRLPAFTPMTGHRLTLRPFEEDELPKVWEVLQRRASGPGPVGRRVEERLRHRIQRSGHFTRGMLDLAVEAQGRLIGDVQARQPPGAMPRGVFELGIEIYDPADHGKGYGSEAVGLLTDWLFEQAAAERVQAGTSLTNASMRTVLERLGFVFEGVMRGFMAAGSGRDDYALYGVTKPEWEACRRP